jgi:hypothetical protein
VAAEVGAIYASAPAIAQRGVVYESIGARHYVLRDATRTFEFRGNAWHPAMPDAGTPIYFEAPDGIMRLDPGTGKTSLVPVDLRDPEEVAVAHDGSQVAVVDAGRLYTFDGSLTRQIAARGIVHDPSFAPGDRELVFATEDSGRWQIVLGNNVILQDGSALASPSISNDGRYLAFARRRGGNWQVWIRRLASGEERRLTGGACNNFAPAWWPDSRQIVFASDCGRGLGLPALFRAPIGD